MDRAQIMQRLESPILPDLSALLVALRRELGSGSLPVLAEAIGASHGSVEDVLYKRTMTPRLELANGIMANAIRIFGYEKSRKIWEGKNV